MTKKFSMQRFAQGKIADKRAPEALHRKNLQEETLTGVHEYCHNRESERHVKIAKAT